MVLKNELGQTAGDGSTLIQSAGHLTYNKITNYSSPVNSASGYAKLAEEYKKERQEPNSIIGQIVDKLQHFSKNIDPVFIGLEQKLIDSGFENELQFASLLKEQYTMYLTSNNLSKATQKIHAFLLARIFVAFNMYIPQAISEGKTKTEIKEIILEKIVKPVEEELGVDNVLDLYQDDVMAMVYFLTGNCYIKWEGHVSISPSV
ncbi:MAG: ABC-three component system protein [Bacteroidota bacterium]